MKTYLFAATCLCFQTTLFAQEPNFEAQAIDDQIQIGYGLSIGEVNGDHKTDILLADKDDIVWYQNPGVTGTRWVRHVMAHKLTQRDNVCIAARDLDGDGLVEVAVGANWNPSETSDIQASGAVFYLERPADPTQPWPSVPLTPYDPTTHRMHWIRSAGTFELVVLPLHGRGNKDGQGEPVRVTAYSRGAAGSSVWTSRLLDQSQHMTHNFDPIQSDDGSVSEALLIGGSEGVIRVTASGEVKRLVANPPSRGAGEVRLMRVTSEAEFATIEPMHGNDVVFYGKRPDGSWNRVVIDSSLNQGHGLATGDLLGIGRQQIVAGWRNKDSDGKVGVRLYVPNELGTEWQRHTIDDNRMACEDLKVADLNADGRLDIIAAGRATQNLVVYWNRSAKAAEK